MENISNKYTVYIDEAGDLGIQRRTKWFVITAVIVHTSEEQVYQICNSTYKNKTQP